MEQKILLGVQLYLLISRSANSPAAARGVLSFHDEPRHRRPGDRHRLSAQLPRSDPAEDAEFRTPRRPAAGDAAHRLARSVRRAAALALAEVLTSPRFAIRIWSCSRTPARCPCWCAAARSPPGDFSRLYPGRARGAGGRRRSTTATSSPTSTPRRTSPAPSSTSRSPSEGSAEISQTARPRHESPRSASASASPSRPCATPMPRSTAQQLRAGTMVEASIEDKHHRAGRGGDLPAGSAPARAGVRRAVPSRRQPQHLSRLQQSRPARGGRHPPLARRRGRDPAEDRLRLRSTRPASWRCCGPPHPILVGTVAGARTGIIC